MQYFGAVLSDHMGLGKTLQLITSLDIAMRSCDDGGGADRSRPPGAAPAGGGDETAPPPAATAAAGGTGMGAAAASGSGSGHSEEGADSEDEAEEALRRKVEREVAEYLRGEGGRPRAAGSASVTLRPARLVAVPHPVPRVATVLVLAPTTVCRNWVDEFRRWLPDGERPELTLLIPVRCARTKASPPHPLNRATPPSQGTPLPARLRALQAWQRRGGVLVLGYEMFRALVRPDLGFDDGEGKQASGASSKPAPVPNPGAPQPVGGGVDAGMSHDAPRPKKRGTVTSLRRDNGSLKRRARASADGGGDSSDSSGSDSEEPARVAPSKRAEGEAPNRAVRTARRALCRPGPDVVVLDEGHRMRSHESQLYRAVRRVRTRRRIVLSACPLQNHLMEYFHMVDCVRPGYLGSRQAFRGYFERVIRQGLLRNSEQGDIAAARQRAFVLSQQLRPVVLRRYARGGPSCHRGATCDDPSPPPPRPLRPSGPEHLTPQLPRKREWVVHCRLSDLQAQLYKAFLRDRQQRIARAEARREERRVRGEAVAPRDPGSDRNPDVLAAYQVSPLSPAQGATGGECPPRHPPCANPPLPLSGARCRWRWSTTRTSYMPRSIRSWDHGWLMTLSRRSRSRIWVTRKAPGPSQHRGDRLTPLWRTATRTLRPRVAHLPRLHINGNSLSPAAAEKAGEQVQKLMLWW